MNFSTRDLPKMRDPTPREPKSIFKFSQQPESAEGCLTAFESPTLIVGWVEDAGRLSPFVIDYINRRLGAKSFCEVEPAGFFSLEGVAIENDTAQFPQGKFYNCQRNDLVTFKGNEPRLERYEFLSALSDLARHYCKIRQLYTIGGTISSAAHTDSRRILSVFNQQQMQEELAGLGLENMNWQGPPAISSFLLWVAQRKGISGVSLWTEIPFYLAADTDFQAVKATLSFLDRKFDLSLDFTDLDEQIRQQNTKIDQLRQDDSQIDRYIASLESGLSLGAEEQVELTKKVTEVLEKI